MDGIRVNCCIHVVHYSRNCAFESCIYPCLQILLPLFRKANWQSIDWSLVGVYFSGHPPIICFVLSVHLLFQNKRFFSAETGNVLTTCTRVSGLWLANFGFMEILNKYQKKVLSLSLCVNSCLQTFFRALTFVQCTYRGWSKVGYPDLSLCHTSGDSVNLYIQFLRGVLVICGNAESNLRNEICGSRLQNGG